jgi:serine/threonine protein kinase
MTLAAGTNIERYEIVTPLGAGGMGEVYRAKDSSLGRDGAIKVLPSMARDAERLRRSHLRLLPKNWRDADL